MDKNGPEERNRYIWFIQATLTNWDWCLIDWYDGTLKHSNWEPTRPDLPNILMYIILKVANQFLPQWCHSSMKKIKSFPQQTISQKGVSKKHWKGFPQVNVTALEREPLQNSNSNSARMIWKSHSNGIFMVQSLYRA